MNLILKIQKFNNDDVITTSGCIASSPNNHIYIIDATNARETVY